MYIVIQVESLVQQDNSICFGIVFIFICYDFWYVEGIYLLDYIQLRIRVRSGERLGKRVMVVQEEFFKMFSIKKVFNKCLFYIFFQILVFKINFIVIIGLLL